ncbi:unnamed protein product [Hydatigera taeniaeformis]|uniref:Probable tRNA(His) guanylyltransferase n=1 Tax=Hydatigena taeniaeformis TaxID=6205 RepID=A0A0R3XB02_HYDTA|nr:unnamed protein product [Hydatigera taeniaeformis]
MMVLWFFLVLPLVSSFPFSCHKCDENCRVRYNNGSLVEACVYGCHSFVGPYAHTDEFGVNLNCEQGCSHFADDDLKSACYVGCTYIPPMEIGEPQNDPMPIFDTLRSPIMSKIFSLFVNGNGRKLNFNESDLLSELEEGQLPVRETHVRVVVPKDPSDMMDDEMYVMMNVMHDSNEEPSDPLQAIPPSSNDDHSEVSTFARTFCRRARIALHNLASHPLFLVSIILMFVSSVTLLAFACVRLSARRARWTTFQRQYRRMPAFFKPASVSVSLLTPQPTSEDDEASELPPKEPFDQKDPLQKFILIVAQHYILARKIYPLLFSLNRTKMTNSVYSYVRDYEAEVPCLLNTWIVVRLDGQAFHKFADKHDFVKPNDERALKLACAAAKRVMSQHNDIVLAYGQSDEFSFVFRRSTDSFNRRPRCVLF